MTYDFKKDWEESRKIVLLMCLLLLIPLFTAFYFDFVFGSLILAFSMFMWGMATAWELTYWDMKRKRLNEK